MASIMWFCLTPWGTLLIYLPGCPPNTVFLGIKVFSETIVLSSIMQLSSITTLSSKTQFLPIRTQSPIKFALTMVSGPIIVYFPIEIEV